MSEKKKYKWEKYILAAGCLAGIALGVFFCYFALIFNPNQVENLVKPGLAELSLFFVFGFAAGAGLVWCLIPVIKFVSICVNRLR